MFHHFADNAEVIEIIHDKVQAGRAFGFDREIDWKLPLQIVCPDYDGKTALYQAVES